MAESHSSGGFLAWRRRHALPPGTACANCATTLQGPWCHACGQSAFDFHRHASHMVGETIESVFHADGRLWRTLGRLVVQPARLTRDYLAGKRAPQIPPLRLFLVAVFLLFLVGEHTAHLFDFQPGALPAEGMSPEDRADLQAAQSAVRAARVRGFGPGIDGTVTQWFRVHASRAQQHPDELLRAMRERAETFAILMLPISALILALLFVRRAGVVLFDHLVFSMHSLSFQAFLFTIVALGEMLLGGGVSILAWASPVHLFFHMRGTYRLGTLGTLVRMAVLFVVSSLAFAVLMVALVGVGLATLG